MNECKTFIFIKGWHVWYQSKYRGNNYKFLSKDWISSKFGLQDFPKLSSHFCKEQFPGNIVLKQQYKTLCNKMCDRYGFENYAAWIERFMCKSMFERFSEICMKAKKVLGNRQKFNIIKINLLNLISHFFSLQWQSPLSLFNSTELV